MNIYPVPISIHLFILGQVGNFKEKNDLISCVKWDQSVMICCFLTENCYTSFRIIVVQSEESEEDRSATLTTTTAIGSSAAGASATASEDSEAGVNLFILAGHEAMQL